MNYPDIRVHGLLLAGLVGAACTPCSARAQTPVAPPQIMTVTPTGVSLNDGNFTTSDTDFSIGPLTLERSYISGKETSNKPFGAGWGHNYDIWARSYLLRGQAIIDVVIGRKSYLINGTPTSNYPSESGISLTSVGGAMVFTERDGTVYEFQTGNFPRVSRILYPDGQIVTANYVSNLLKTLVSNRGYAIVFDYSGSVVTAACGYNLATTYVTTASTCAAATLKTGYGYTSSRLTSFTDASGSAAYFAYANLPNWYQGELSCITDPGTTACRITNSYTMNPHLALPNVTQQVTADGGIWRYDCSCGSSAQADPDDPFAVEYNDVTDPGGKVASYWFVQGSPYRKYDENGKLTQYSFAGRFPFSATLPEGNQVTWAYSSRMAPASLTSVAKPGSGAASITADIRTYPSTCTNPSNCNLPISITDAKGNQTDYAYASWGGVTSELRPAPAPGAARPLKLNTYVQKYAYVKNAGGALVAAASPVWMPDTETICQTYAGSSALTCDPAAPITVTAFEYGANGTADNLLLRGRVVSSGGASLRTCYGYDWKGRKISETSPRAGLASCS